MGSSLASTWRFGSAPAWKERWGMRAMVWPSPSSAFTPTGLGTLEGSLTAAIPARSGLSARVRMPFYVIPGDLLFLSPMYFTNRQKYTELAVTAANGGLLGWQQGYATSIGRFQFVLGRELGITWYGLL